MRMRTLLLVGVVAFACAAGSAHATRTAGPCLSLLEQQEGALVTAVERRINGNSWSARKMCCTNTHCVWLRGANSQKLTATVKRLTATFWVLTLRGQVCSVLSTAPIGRTVSVVSIQCQKR